MRNKSLINQESKNIELQSTGKRDVDVKSLKGAEKYKKQIEIIGMGCSAALGHIVRDIKESLVNSDKVDSLSETGLVYQGEKDRNASYLNRLRKIESNYQERQYDKDPRDFFTRNSDVFDVTNVVISSNSKRLDTVLESNEENIKEANDEKFQLNSKNISNNSQGPQNNESLLGCGVDAAHVSNVINRNFGNVASILSGSLKDVNKNLGQMHKLLNKDVKAMESQKLKNALQTPENKVILDHLLNGLERIVDVVSVCEEDIDANAGDKLEVARKAIDQTFFMERALFNAYLSCRNSLNELEERSITGNMNDSNAKEIAGYYDTLRFNLETKFKVIWENLFAKDGKITKVNKRLHASMESGIGNIPTLNSQAKENLKKMLNEGVEAKDFSKQLAYFLMASQRKSKIKAHFSNVISDSKEYARGDDIGRAFNIVMPSKYKYGVEMDYDGHYAVHVGARSVKTYSRLFGRKAKGFLWASMIAGSHSIISLSPVLLFVSQSSRFSMSRYLPENNMVRTYIFMLSVIFSTNIANSIFSSYLEIDIRGQGGDGMLPRNLNASAASAGELMSSMLSEVCKNVKNLSSANLANSVKIFGDLYTRVHKEPLSSPEVEKSRPIIEKFYGPALFHSVNAKYIGQLNQSLELKAERNRGSERLIIGLVR